jgi:hypothetical protein
MPHHYVHAHTSTETLQEIDAIIDEVKDDIKKNKKIDIEAFKKVYSIYSLFRNNHYVNDDIISIEEPEVLASFSQMELFMTVYKLNCKLRVSNRKRRVGVSANFIWYALATSKLLTINALSRLMAEIDDTRFSRNMALFLIDHSEWKEKIKQVVMLNPNITDEIRLWLQLQ